MLKHLKYLWYVIKHKWYVFIECCKLGIPIKGLLHDLSKFKPSEWYPYTNYFYGNYPSEKEMTALEFWKYDGITKEIIKNQFDKAWLYHQNRNKHHWQYWILQKDSGSTKILEMPDKYKKEMLADWIGAGKAITDSDNCKEWYKNNKDKMLLHKNTRLWIENKIFTGFEGYWEKQLLDVEPEVKQIVNDWKRDKFVQSEEYMDKYTDEQNQKAHEIIMEAISSGLG